MLHRLQWLYMLPSFPLKHCALRKKHFDENNSEEVILQAEKDFKVCYFLVMVDMAKISLKSRFDKTRLIK